METLPRSGRPGRERTIDTTGDPRRIGSGDDSVRLALRSRFETFAVEPRERSAGRDTRRQRGNALNAAGGPTMVAGVVGRSVQRVRTIGWRPQEGVVE
jgi:hypothetical protein